jgi:hypothetical protein
VQAAAKFGIGKTTDAAEADESVPDMDVGPVVMKGPRGSTIRLDKKMALAIDKRANFSGASHRSSLQVFVDG